VRYKIKDLRLFLAVLALVDPGLRYFTVFIVYVCLWWFIVRCNILFFVLVPSIAKNLDGSKVWCAQA
jgi:hypothetical protein